MYKRVPLLLLLSVFILLLSSCKKEFNFDNWAPDMLGPIIKSKVTAREVCDLKNKKFTQEIDVSNIGSFPLNIPLNVPVLDFKNTVIGPFEVELSDFFSFVEVDSALMTIKLYNSFPIIIGSGTNIVFRTSKFTTDELNVILRDTIRLNIFPKDSYQTEKFLRSKKVTSNVYLYLEKFNSPGGSGAIFSSEPTTLSFEFKFLNVVTVGLHTGREHTEVDTTEILFMDDVSDYEDNTAVGTLRVFLTNAMPINCGFQMYFLDKSKQTVIDSLYYYQEIREPHHDMYLGAGITKPLTGDTISSTTDSFKFPISASRIRKLKEARHVVFRLKGDTYGHNTNEVYVGANSNLQILITGDLKIRIVNLF